MSRGVVSMLSARSARSTPPPPTLEVVGGGGKGEERRPLNAFVVSTAIYVRHLLSLPPPPNCPLTECIRKPSLTSCGYRRTQLSLLHLALRRKLPRGCGAYKVTPIIAKGSQAPRFHMQNHLPFERFYLAHNRAVHKK